jgi:hypothetical protein
VARPADPTRGTIRFLTAPGARVTFKGLGRPDRAFAYQRRPHKRIIGSRGRELDPRTCRLGVNGTQAALLPRTARLRLNLD